MKPYRAIVFDVLGTLLDADALVERLRGRVPDESAFVAQWRRKQLEYGFLAAAAHHDTNFHRVTLEALEFVLAARRLEADARAKDDLLAAWSRLPAFPDAQPALAQLAVSQMLVALTNGPERATLDALSAAGLDVLFESVRSSDEVRRWKPAPEVYELA